MKVIRDLAYVPGGHPRQTLDLYLPEPGGEPVPLLVWIHGGGWRMGDKEQTGPLRPLVDEGYALASLNYRLSQHAIYPAQIVDCRAAVRWLRANAATYGLDPARVGVGGDSAGGHLAALLGTAAAHEPVKVQAVLDFYGPTNFATMGGHHDDPDSAEAQLVGGPVQANLDRVAAASPVTTVSADSAPFLIFHGDRDETVDISQSRALVDALQQAGVEVTFRPIAGAGHGGPEFASDEVMGIIRGFFGRYLKNAGNAG